MYVRIWFQIISPRTSVGFRVNALYIAICINQTCPDAKIFKVLLEGL